MTREQAKKWAELFTALKCVLYGAFIVCAIFLFFVNCELYKQVDERQRIIEKFMTLIYKKDSLIVELIEKEDICSEMQIKK